MHISHNIKFLRKQRAWTQEQLAQKLNKTYITVGDYERGKALPPLNIVIDLCRIFEVDIETLVLKDIKKDGIPVEQEEQQKQIIEKYTTLQRLAELQEHRLAELEREIREQAPDLARKLGLK